MSWLEDDLSHEGQLSSMDGSQSFSSLARAEATLRAALEDDQDDSSLHEQDRSVRKRQWAVRLCAVLVSIILVAVAALMITLNRNERKEWDADYGHFDLSTDFPTAAPTAPTASLSILGWYMWPSSEDEDESSITNAGNTGDADEVDYDAHEDVSYTGETQQSVETELALIFETEETRSPTAAPTLRQTRPMAMPSAEPMSMAKSSPRPTSSVTTHAKTWPYTPFELYLPPPGRATEIFALLQSAVSLLPTSDGYDPLQALNDPNRPSHKAYLWIVDEDPMKLDPLSDDAEVSTLYPILVERFTLVLLFIDTGGLDSGRAPPIYRPIEEDGWVYAYGYLSGQTVCDWYGTECDEEGSVVGLHLAENGLATSAVPLELSLLHGLRTLDFRSNEISGQLPEFLSSLPLKYLDLSENLFAEGPISQGLYDVGLSADGEMSLEYLALGGCRLTGTLSADGASKWGRLKYLSLEDNFLSGLVPEQIVATELEDLNLGRNFFNGPFPWSAVTTKMTSLRNLWIYENEFSGALPRDISILNHLSRFVVHENYFSGSIPAFPASLTRAYLHRTELSGTIPLNMGSLSQLEVLYLHHTHLTGDMPTAICELRVSALLGDLRADCDPPPEVGGSERNGDLRSNYVSCPCCTHCFSTGSRDRDVMI